MISNTDAETQNSGTEPVSTVGSKHIGSDYFTKSIGLKPDIMSDSEDIKKGVKDETIITEDDPAVPSQYGQQENDMNSSMIVNSAVHHDFFFEKIRRDAKNDKMSVWKKMQTQKRLWSLKREADSQLRKLNDVQLEESSRKGETVSFHSMYSPSPTRNGLSVSISLHHSNFYAEMKSFNRFKEIMNDDMFQYAPADWHVIITDIVESTRKIEAGAYTDVNTIGAASISTVLQELGDECVPYVFGGDGASLLIPPHCIGRALEVLMRLQKLARDNFELELRVGHVPVNTLLDEGFKIEVGKYELYGGRCFAVFRGGGLTEAEVRIKSNPEKYCVKGPDERGGLDLNGLSCRWKPIPSKRGKIMSLIVKSNDLSVYSEVLEQLDKLYNGKLDESNPVDMELMSFKSLKNVYENEKRYNSTIGSRFYARLVEIGMAVSIWGHNVNPVYFDVQNYNETFKSHADFQKFDDMLRMVIDCSDDQAGSIVALLKTEYDKGRLTYGVHISKRAIITCYVEDETKDGGRIHFIDGDNGGYSVAAKQMKWQKRRESRIET
eukprot:scaffold15609_cov55-Attheya_sp.AAC.6